MTVAQEIAGKLQEAFQPTRLEVADESERHRGHSGWQEGGETHFRVVISSPAFAGLSRIQCHRKVHEALSPNPMADIHALSLKISAE